MHRPWFAHRLNGGPHRRRHGVRRHSPSGRHQERLPAGEQPGHDGPDSHGRVRTGRRGERPRAGVPGPRTRQERVRNAPRREQHPDPVVRRGIRHGRPDQHRAPLPPRLRDGARVEPSSATGRAGVHRRQHSDHDRVHCERRRPGGGVRHRDPGDDGLGRRGGHHLGQVTRTAKSASGLRHPHRRAALRASRQHHRATRRDHDLGLLHRRNHRRVFDLPSGAHHAGAPASPRGEGGLS